MGTSVRVFVVHDDDTIERFPTSKYDRLDGREGAERFPEFVSKDVRFAVAFVELMDRRPVALRHMYFEIRRFDERGYLDRATHERSLELAIALLDRPAGRDGVINAAARFARRELDARHIWSPNKEVLRAVTQAAMAPPRERGRPRRRHLRLVASQDST